jgi:hypothetical protein
MRELLIESEFHAARDLLRSLAPRLQDHAVDLELRRRDTPFRAEPSVLVATSPDDAPIGELVAGLLAALPAADRACSAIQLKDHAGIVAEVPGSASPEEVPERLRPIGNRRVTQVYVVDVEPAADPARRLPVRPATTPPTGRPRDEPPKPMT